MDSSRPKHGLFGQVLRFCVFGAASGVFDYGGTLLISMLTGADTLARAVGFIVGSTIAYLLNRRWTFRSQRDTREIAAISVVYVLTFLIILVVHKLVLATMAVSFWQRTVAWVVSQGFGTTFNFLAQRSYVFHR